MEFEDAAEALALLQSHRVKISKFHLSNALKLRIADRGLTSASLRRALSNRSVESRTEELAPFADDTYLHQVVARTADGGLHRFRDLDVFLNPQSAPSAVGPAKAEIRNPQWAEARVHFHIPLHAPPGARFDTTSDHLLGVLDVLQVNPNLCSHLEMETYTWAVLPPALKSRSVVDQLAAEYEWTLRELRRRRLA